MWNELDVVRDVSNRLDTAGLEFMLTGSMAMNFYAQPHMTRDIDIVIAHWTEILGLSSLWSEIQS
jgi:hypothetical protein